MPSADPTTEYEFVTDPGRLSALLNSWDTSRISVDTEFVRTKTYFSKPGLIQLMTDDIITLIDPIALDLTPLLPLLIDQNTLKILHAAAEDLSLLEQLTGQAPSPIFDCQIAAALTGREASTSYHALVKDFLGITLTKGETRSNWCQRPLRAAQLGYAADDVRYLARLHFALEKELGALGRLEWAKEEFRNLTYRTISPAFSRLREAAKLSRPQLATLERLWSWRDDQARARDLPRGRVLEDRTLIEIALVAPSTRERLSRIEGLSPRKVRRSGDAILNQIAQSRDLDESQWPLPLIVPLALRGLVGELRQQTRERAAAHGLAPEFIASKRQIETLVIAAAYGRLDHKHPILRGWRVELLGPQFQRALPGENV